MSPSSSNELNSLMETEIFAKERKTSYLQVCLLTSAPLISYSLVFYVHKPARQTFPVDTSNSA